jgi:hypothetical protein
MSDPVRSAVVSAEGVVENIIIADDTFTKQAGDVMYQVLAVGGGGGGGGQNGQGGGAGGAGGAGRVTIVVWG